MILLANDFGNILAQPRYPPEPFLKNLHMNKSTLYVILAVALGLLVGFVLVMYLLRPSPPTINANLGDRLTMSRTA